MLSTKLSNIPSKPVNTLYSTVGQLCFKFTAFFPTVIETKLSERVI